MKAQSGFVLRNLAGEYVLAPVGDQIKSYDALVVMNELSAFLWDRLQRDVSRQDLLSAVLDEYDVEEETCARDIDAVLAKMRAIGLLTD